MEVKATHAPERLEPRSREGALRERSVLATFGLVVGVLGGTAIAFGLVLYAIDPKVLPLTLLNVAVGAVAVLFYGLTNAREVGSAFAGRSTALIALEALIVVGVFGGLVAGNVVAARSELEWDLTRDRLYTLQEQSIRVASQLTRPVKVLAFLRASDPPRGRLVELVELYRRHTKALTLEIVSPDSAPPALLEKYGMAGDSPRIMVTTEEGRTAKIKQPTEDLLTNALVKVAGRPAQEIAFLTGHGGPRLDDEKSETGFMRAVVSLRNEGHKVDTLTLLDKDAIPAGKSVIVVHAPESPLLPNEAAALLKWVTAGGRLLVMLEPGKASGLDPLFSELGIEVGDDLVVDPNAASRGLGFGADAPLVQRFEPHPITAPLEGSAALFFTVRSVAPRLGGGRAKVVTLARTSPESWAEREYRDTKEVARDESDAPGPIPIAVAATLRTLAAENRVTDEGRVVVFGDSSFANNRFGAMSGNGDLFTNAVNWLAGEEDRITIRPKARGSSRLLLREDQQYGIMFFSVNLLPLVIIGVGFSVWAVRRRK